MKVCFVYAAPDGFSGQFLATKLLLDNLPSSIERLPVPLPAWSGKLWSLPGYAWRLLMSWLKIARHGRNAESFYINAGQSMFAIVRDGGSLLTARLTNPKSKKIISLHGNVFTQWPSDSRIARLFVWMCNLGHVVTVLGPNQQLALRQLGVRSLIEIVDNSAAFHSLEPNQLIEKHRSEPLKILSLGNLLETKGYPLFLEALERLAQDGRIGINAVLAGDFIRDSHPVRFHSLGDAENWVAAKVASINSSANVRIDWIRGVKGTRKDEILRQAQILVFPSCYPIEAQPIVLLEAMATGTTILTSRAGEISSTVNDQAAVFLESLSAETIASAIIALQDVELRLKLARNGLRLFQERYTLSHYIDVWTRLICER